MLHLTIGNWIAIAIAFIVVVIVGLYIGGDDSPVKAFIISAIVGLVVCIAVIFGLNWYNSSTAQGMRNYKDYQSNMENGINREINITAEDGREIFHYEGKIDIETDHTDNYIKFESEDGKRYIIMYGITDTITIIEK